MLRSGTVFGGRSTSRAAVLYATVAVLFILVVFVWSPLPADYATSRDDLVQQVTHTLPGQILAPGEKPQLAPFGAQHKYAFATFLAGEGAREDEADINDDPYFVATRILTYQLIYAPETRSPAGYPFIVLVTPAVSEAKRQRLRKDGAVVIEAAPVDPGWVVQTEVAAWGSVMSKLRLWEFTQYERIVFLDGDTVLNKPLDGIFDDPAVAQQMTSTHETGLHSDEGTMPRQYVFAGQPEMNHKHHYPPSDQQHDYPNINYLNAGFFVFKPDREMREYYLSLTKTGTDQNGKHRFPPNLPEQNLLNYAHRPEGNMPWKMLDTKWNIHYPTEADLEGGVVTLHEKWWAPEHAELKPYLAGWKGRMQGFFEAKDSMV